MTKIIGIIPSRFDSTRFPGKSLAKIGGKSMIQRVYEQAYKSELLDEVIVATDDNRILNHVKAFGGKVIMTSKAHQSGTDRCAEVVSKLDDVDVVINIQGDEPFIEPEQIDQLATCFQNPKAQIVTLIKKIESEIDLHNDTVVKVETKSDGQGSDFSRKPFSELEVAYKHIGIYGYRTDTLRTISKLPQSEREVTERLEQLRWLDNGFKIQVAETEHESNSVDTPEDLEQILREKNL
jgi:3-deoxy-manno-octulosonate cytidylyltransferase (CMP-KDO synthetase)